MRAPERAHPLVPAATVTTRELTHHDVVATQLRPHLCDAGEESAAEVLGLEEIEVASRGEGPVELDLALDLEVLKLYELVLRVTFGVDVGEDCKWRKQGEEEVVVVVEKSIRYCVFRGMTVRTLERLLFPAVVHEPARRLGEGEHEESKDQARDGLERPGHPEGGVVRDVRAPEGHEVLQELREGDGELLRRDNPAPDGRAGDLCLVDRDDGRTEPDCESGDDATSNERADVEAGGLDDAAEDPDPARDDLATESERKCTAGDLNEAKQDVRCTICDQSCR